MARARIETALNSKSLSDPESASIWTGYFSSACVRLVGLCAAGLVVCTALYFLAPYNRIAETTTHFVTGYAVFGTIAAAIAMVLRRWKLAALCTVFALFYLALVAPWFFPRPPKPAGGEPNLRIISANVLSINDQTDRFLEFVQAANPDILFVQELSPLWGRALEPIKETYPHHVERTQSDHFGIGLYSKLPLENVSVFEPVRTRFPAIRANVLVNDRLVSLLNFHTAPPVTAELFALRNEQLKAAAGFALMQEGLVIVGGDLNTTMWSPYYREMESESALRNTRRGFGILPTWPANLLVFQIPLDHILVSPDILTVDIQRGPDINSDHLPIIADLWISVPGRPGF